MLRIIANRLHLYNKARQFFDKQYINSFFMLKSFSAIRAINLIQRTFADRRRFGIRFGHYNNWRVAALARGS